MAQGNPRYSSEDGLILNAEGAEILGVPTGRTALTVKNGVTQVALPYSNSLRALVLETESLEDLPEINYARLSRGCRIVVPDELLTAYLTDQREMLQRTGLSVIPASQYDPRQDGSQSGYVLRDDCLLTSDLRLHQALRESAHWLALPDGITGVEAGALSGLSDGLEVLILPQGTRAVGYQTFRNCWNLEGVLIERRGAFLLSKNAFEGSASLRFVASNAPTMILEDPDLALFNNDISLEYSFLYCLGDNSG